MTILTSVMQFAMLPLQGIAQGARPITSYNYGAKKLSRVKAELQDPALCLCYLFRCSVGNYHGISTGICKIVYHRCFALIDFTAKALRIYCRVLFVFGIQIASPDDLCVHRECTVFHYRGNPAEIHIADSIDLHITACYGK